MSNDDVRIAKSVKLVNPAKQAEPAKPVKSTKPAKPVATQESSHVNRQNDVLSNALASGDTGASEYQPTIPNSENETRKNELKKIADEYGITENELYKFLNKIGYTDEVLFSSDEDFGNITNNINWILFKLKEYTGNKSKSKLLNDIADKINAALQNNPNLTLTNIADMIQEYCNADIVGISQMVMNKSENEHLKNKLNSVKSLNDKDDKGNYIITDEDLIQLVEEFFAKSLSSKNIEDKMNKFNQFIAILDVKIDNEETYNRLYGAFKTFAKGNEKLNRIFTFTEKLKEAESVETFLQETLGEEKGRELLNNPTIKAEEIKELLVNIKKALGENKPIPQECIEDLLKLMREQIEEYNELKNKADNGEISEEEQIKFEKMNAIYAFIMSEGNKKQQKEAFDIAKNAGTLEDIYRILYEIAQENPDFNITEKIDNLTNGEFSTFVNEKICIDNPDTTCDNDNPTQTYGEYTVFPQRVTAETCDTIKSAITEKQKSFEPTEEKLTIEPICEPFNKSSILSQDKSTIKMWLKNRFCKMSELYKMCTSQDTALREIIGDDLDKKNKDDYIYYINMLVNGAKVYFALNNNKYKYDPDIQEKIQLSYDAKAQLKEKLKKDGTYNNKVELS